MWLVASPCSGPLLQVLTLPLASLGVCLLIECGLDVVCIRCASCCVFSPSVGSSLSSLALPLLLDSSHLYILAPGSTDSFSQNFSYFHLGRLLCCCCKLTVFLLQSPLCYRSFRSFTSSGSEPALLPLSPVSLYSAFSSALLST